MRVRTRYPKCTILTLACLADPFTFAAMDPLFRSVVLSSRRLGSLSEVGAEAAAALKGAKQNVTIFEHHSRSHSGFSSVVAWGIFLHYLWCSDVRQRQSTGRSRQHRPVHA